MSAAMASCAARLISAGAEKSGNPCARLTAPYCMACRVISRMTDSVKCSTLSERKCLGWAETWVMESKASTRNADAGTEDFRGPARQSPAGTSRRRQGWGEIPARYASASSYSAILKEKLPTAYVFKL